MLTEIKMPIITPHQQNGGTSNRSTLTDWAQQRADMYNETSGNLTGVDCPKCKNKGHHMVIDSRGNTAMQECECMASRRALWNMQKSGLGDLLERYTLDNWKTPEEWQANMKGVIQKFADKPKGWFYIAGRPGTGKTHLCTALCSMLLHKGMEVKYLVWRDFTVKAKSHVTDSEEYASIVEPYKRAKVLYLDDLFKTGRNNPTEGDINLAFELLNDRYNDSDYITIISSELDVDRLLSIDEALGSRIYEKSKRNYYDLTKRENWRIANGD